MKVLPAGVLELRELLSALGRQPDDERARSARPEAVLVTLLEELRARDLDGDVSVLDEAASRGRRQGVVAGLAGGASEGLVDTLQILDEVVVAATAARRWAPGRDALDRAGDLLVLWELMPDETAARAALTGSGPSLFERWSGDRQVLPPERWTPRSTLAWIWRSRRALTEALDAKDTVKLRHLVPGLGVVGGARREKRERLEWRERVLERYGAPS